MALSFSMMRIFEHWMHAAFLFPLSLSPSLPLSLSPLSSSQYILVSVESGLFIILPSQCIWYGTANLSYFCCRFLHSCLLKIRPAMI
jgi:hypothetical protein